MQRLRLLRVGLPVRGAWRSESGRNAHKCTLCYDRQKDGIEPACAKACPTRLDPFRPGEELRERARERLGEVRARGAESIPVRRDDAGEYKRLNAFFLLTEEPAAYNLPEAPIMPTAGMKQEVYVERGVWGSGLAW